MRKAAALGVRLALVAVIVVGLVTGEVDALSVGHEAVESARLMTAVRGTAM